MTRQDELNKAWCKYRGKCSTEILQALAFALRWCDEHPNWEAIVKRLQEEITNDLRQDRWISVEDELPPIRETLGRSDIVLVCTAEERTGIAYYNHVNKAWVSSATRNVTHWMPLPLPVVPKTETSESVKPTNSMIKKGGKQ